jgi:hypothetical protein
MAGSYKKKSYREKLMDSKDLPFVETIPERMVRTCGEGTLVVPAPLEVDEMMRKVPAGKVVTVNMIREALARKHGTTVACPMCTGLFAGIAAHAAAEDAAEGRRDITPYWRTLKEGGVINEKYPGGVEGQKELLEKEGHVVMQKGKKLVVSDFQKNLIDGETLHPVRQ